MTKLGPEQMIHRPLCHKVYPQTLTKRRKNTRLQEFKDQEIPWQRSLKTMPDGSPALPKTTSWQFAKLAGPQSLTIADESLKFTIQEDWNALI